MNDGKPNIQVKEVTTEGSSGLSRVCPETTPNVALLIFLPPDLSLILFLSLSQAGRCINWGTVLTKRVILWTDSSSRI